MKKSTHGHKQGVKRILPRFIENALGQVDVLDTSREEKSIQEFVDKWGGSTPAHFLKALREGDRDEQQLAAFALGETRSAWARHILIPYLEHGDAEVRWAAALMLGQMREEAAFPVLLHMLQEFLPPHGFVSYDWFDVQHRQVASILGSWGKREAIPALHETLAQLWEVEQRRSPEEDIQLWWQYEDALAYALGQLEAFDALDGLQLPLPRRRLWSVNMVMGYLNAETAYYKDILGLIMDASHQEDYTTFLETLVIPTLQQKMGLSLEEARSYIDLYADDYFERWPPTVGTWSRCRD